MKGFAVVLLLSAWLAFGAEPAWKSEIPSGARESGSWLALLSALQGAELPYGAMGAAARILAYFPELAAKQKAYEAVLALVDRDYPVPMSGLFASGDLEAGFSRGYDFVKYVIHHEAGMERWAREYRSDAATEPKLAFYLALQDYEAGRTEPAVSRLKAILAADKGTGSGSLAIRAARTLARIHFESGRFERALDIYSSFLLKLNPVRPADWLEAAWCDYHLHRYAEALGLLYNLESRAAGPVPSLERYTLRALVYRELCAVGAAKELVASFERDFGAALAGIREGKSPARFPELGRVAASPQALALAALRREADSIDEKVPSPLRPFARELYDSESRLLESEARSDSEAALERASREVVTTAEGLRFLRFDVEREKFDPDRVFRARAGASELPEPRGDFVVRWPQQGEFWRGERLAYRAELRSECGE
jgi:tetratricopeptide (TPR) repeat protein